MAYPQGYLYQPSASLALYSCPAYGTGAGAAMGVIAGPRTEELGRSSSGSAFAPYAAGSAAAAAAAFPGASPPGYGSASSHLPYGADSAAAAAAAAAAAFSSYVGSPYDHTSGMAGSIGYHPYAAPLGSYPYGDPAYRKNATRDATATLKAWLNEHRKNPYPTKGEKIMLAIITKMTLTQVSTWFANARRRLKKENKMTWTPRNRSEDEDEDENIDLEKNDDEEPHKPADKGDSTDTESDHKSLHPGDVVAAACDRFKEETQGRGGDTDPLLSDSELKDHPHEDEQRTAELLLPAHHHHHTSSSSTSSSPRGTEEKKPSDLGPHHPPHHPPPHHHHHSHHHLPATGGTACNGNATSVIHTLPPSSAAAAAAPPPTKPKLWSLAEIATSSDSGAGGVLSRPLYYASPFYPGYTNYAGGFGHLHGNHHHHQQQHHQHHHHPHQGTAALSGTGSTASSAAHLNGLNQTVFTRAEALVRESQKVRSQAQVDLFKDSPYELKKGMSNI
ncbi:hypothetical protein CRUP_022669 [Coryphaenoides rupestris]|nr:hypothetical protein CRUP_022669 [Coryphaenoides rupestris]